MSVDLNWQQLAAFVAVVTAVGGVAWRLIMGRARSVFALRVEHQVLAERLAKVETTQKSAPTSTDINALTVRVGAVETGIAVAKEALTNVQDGIGRVERMTTLLVQHQLGKEGP